MFCNLDHITLKVMLHLNQITPPFLKGGMSFLIPLTGIECSPKPTLHWLLLLSPPSRAAEDGVAGSGQQNPPLMEPPPPPQALEPQMSHRQYTKLLRRYESITECKFVCQKHRRPSNIKTKMLQFGAEKGLLQGPTSFQFSSVQLLSHVRLFAIP